MKNRDIVKQYLEKEPLARERKNKNRAIGNLLIKKYTGRLDAIPKGILAEIVADALTLDRSWRKCLEENPSLRGKNYDQKETLSQNYQIKELGYEPRFHESQKILKLLPEDN